MERLRIESPSGAWAEVLDLGATLHRLVVPAAHGPRDVVLWLESEEERLADPDYLGCTVGRYANRIAGGRFTLDGVEHRLAVNDGDHTLHGGAVGFSRRTWSVVSRGASHVALSLVSEDGDQGFPGRVSVTARFSLSDAADGVVLRTSFTATTDATTVLSMTSHPYWALDGAGSPARDQQLGVPASSYLPVDGDALATGEVASVDGTANDLRELRRMDDLPDLDQTYLVPGDGLRPVAHLRAGSGDLALELWSDQPGVHVYTGSKLPSPYAGVALEPQHLPDSVHHPEWPSTVLRPGETYAWVSEARIGARS